jgi:predicted RNA-binding Zn-ribbon protein involved in translation (DUF1610 family)
MLNFGEKLCKSCGVVSENHAPYCANCGSPLQVVENASIVNTGLCPECGHPGIRVMSTVKPRRYLGCPKCGFRWVTCEVVLIHSQSFVLAERIMKNSKFLFR